jgi:hypothetical protein
MPWKSGIQKMADTKFFASKAVTACGLLIACMMIAGGPLSGATGSRPRNLDLSLERVTDHGMFGIQLKSGLDPIPTSKVHRWSVHVVGAGGAPVSGASITVDGGMPEHGHRLPTAPKAEPTNGPGNYVINGMKFSMTGWWVLKLDIRATDGRMDSITFNVVL